MTEQTESCNGDNTPYVFENVLSVTVNDGNVECGLDNRVEQSEPSETPQKWSVSDYTNAINERYMFVKDSSDPATTYLAQYFFRKGENGFTLLTDTLDTWQESFELNKALFVNGFFDLPYQFNGGDYPSSG